jgi:hypothetical protein
MKTTLEYGGALAGQGRGGGEMCKTVKSLSKPLKQKARPYLKNNWSKKGWKHGSSGRVTPA